jgi:hypothetical protein
VEFVIRPVSHLYRVAVAAPLTSRGNALRADDEAWVTTGASAATNLLVSDLPATALGLNRIAEFDHILPGEPLKDLGRYSLVIFNRTAPSSIELKQSEFPPSLLIMPPSNELATIRDLPSGKEFKFSRWDDGSPLLRYLKPTSVVLYSGADISARPEFMPILRSPAGILLAAAPAHGNMAKSVIVGFEILPFEGDRSPFNSVLLLNIINWLADGRAISGALLVGASTLISEQPVLLRSATTLKEIEPDSATKNVRVESAGLYKVTKNGRANWIAANYFNPAESNFQQPTIQLNDAKNNLAAAKPDRMFFWLQYIVLGALIALALEMIYLARRPNPKSGVVDG